jgi:hypothetical protein
MGPPACQRAFFFSAWLSNCGLACYNVAEGRSGQKKQGGPMERKSLDLQADLEVDEIKMILVALESYIQMSKAALRGVGCDGCAPLSKVERAECRQEIRLAKNCQMKIASAFSSFGMDSEVMDALNQPD